MRWRGSSINSSMASTSRAGQSRAISPSRASLASRDAIAVPVGLVAQRRNAVDLLLAPQLADALDHHLLVHLVGDFRDDDGLTLAAQRLEFDLAAHHDRAAAELVGGANARAAEDDA